MSKKPKIVFATFGRLERLLFWKILAEGSLEVGAIVSDADSKTISNFFQFDSNHGQLLNKKITIKENIKNERNIFFVGKTSANIKIISSKQFNKKFFQEKGYDIIISLDPDIAPLKIDKYESFGTKAVFVSANSKLIKKKDTSLTCFGVNHESIDLGKKKVLIIPPIEAIITILVAKTLENLVPLSSLYFSALVGPTSQSTVLDQILESEAGTFYSRSSFNNLIPLKKNLLHDTINLLFAKNKVSLTAKGEIFQVPVTTAGLMNFIAFSNKIIKRSDLLRAFQDASNNIFGYSSEPLVAQDITSTNHTGIVDESLVQTQTQKDVSLLKAGIWFDYETSFMSNFFQLLLFVSGLPEFN